MTKFKFDVIKSQQVCENIISKQKRYQNTADNLYREVINTKNVWFDLASDTFNRRAQNDYASLSDALDSINKYYANLRDFSIGMHEIFFSKSYKDSRGVIDYDSPYITLAKEKITLIISYLNSALTSLRKSIPSDFEKSKNIKDITDGVSEIVKDMEYLNSKLKEIEQNVENLISVHRNKERAIDFIKIDSNVTRFNWTVVPVSKKINPNVIRVVTYDKVVTAPKIASSNLNMQTADKYTTESNDSIKANNESVDNTINSSEYNNEVSSVDIVSNDKENMQVTSDMTLSIGPVDNLSINNSDMQVTSDMTLSIGAVDNKVSGVDVNSLSDVTFSANSIQSSNLDTNVLNSSDVNISTSSVSNNINSREVLAATDTNISISATESNITNANMQQSTNSDTVINTVKSNSSGVSLNQATDSSITTSTIESSKVGNSSMQRGTNSDTVINAVKSNSSGVSLNQATDSSITTSTIESSKVGNGSMQRGTNSDTIINEVKSSINPNTDL